MELGPGRERVAKRKREQVFEDRGVAKMETWAGLIPLRWNPDSGVVETFLVKRKCEHSSHWCFFGPQMTTTSEARSKAVAERQLSDATGIYPPYPLRGGPFFHRCDGSCKRPDRGYVAFYLSACPPSNFQATHVNEEVLEDARWMVLSEARSLFASESCKALVDDVIEYLAQSPVSRDVPAVSATCPPLGIYFRSKLGPMVIRPMKETDARAVVDGIQESIVHLRKFLLWSHFPQTEQSQRQRIEASRRAYFSGTAYEMGIFTEAGDFVGAIAMFLPSRASLSRSQVEIGYWNRTMYMGKGVMTIAVQSLVAYALLVLGCDRVELYCHSSNLASRRVAVKCGFAYEGVMRNAAPEPTSEQTENGHTTDRNLMVHSIVREDVCGARGWWWDDVVKDCDVVTVLGEKVALSSFAPLLRS